MNDREILEASLIGLELQLTRVGIAISGIRSQLGHRGPGRPAATTEGAQPAPRKRRISAAARKRIGEATRRRWSEFRKAKAEAEKPAEKPKRKMSAAGRRAIVEATKKRWAKFRKAKAEGAKKAIAKKTAPKPKVTKPAAPAPPAA